MGIDNSLGDAFMIHNSAGGVDSSSQLTIATDGDVGIGTVGPDEKLHVSNGKVLVDVTSSVGTELILKNLAVDQFAADKNYHEINFITSSTSSETTGGYVRIKAGQEVSGNDNRSYLGFWTAPDDGAVSEKMRITNGGNVGIGTTTPTYKLVVGGDVDYSSGIGTTNAIFVQDANYPAVVVGVDNQNYGYIKWDVSGGYLSIATKENYANQDNTLVLKTGNVGIGTTSPLDKLQVNEYTVASQGNQGVHGEVSVFADNGDESLFLGLKDSAYPNRGWAINPVAFGVNSSLQFKEHGSTGVRMVIESGGFVGLGVTDPTEKLHLQSTTSGCFIRFADQTASGVYVGSRNDELEIYAGNAERMGIDATGVVRFNAYGTGILQTDTNGVISASLSPLVDGITFNNGASITNQINTDVDTGAEVVAQVSTSTYTAAFFDFVIKKVGNIRSGTVYACHDGTNVEFTETSTQDLGDTSDVTLSVDISGGNMRLLATVTSDDWSVKSLIRAI